MRGLMKKMEIDYNCILLFKFKQKLFDFYKN